MTITLKLVYWVIILIWLILKVVSASGPNNKPAPFAKRLALSLITFEFVLFVILGFKVFGSPF